MSSLLGFKEEQFWRLKPRKLFSLWKTYCKFNGLESKEDKSNVRKGYIDEIF